jgi:RNA polymerase sigma factor (sigma-70 family)
VLLDPELVAAPEASDDLLALDEALQKLEAHDPRVAAMVNLRYFAGLKNKQAAEALGISARTAAYHWAYARAWLRAELLGSA